MKRLTPFVGAALVVAAVAIRADLPEPLPVPAHLNGDARHVVEQQRKDLVDWRGSLIADITKLNEEGQGVSAEKAKELLARKAYLLTQVVEYGKSLVQYDDKIKLITGAPQTSVQLSREDITYFLSDRADTIDLVTLFLPEITTRRWPGEEPPPAHERLVNPLDKEQERRDKEILGPIDPGKVELLDLDQLAQLIHARRRARVREANRKASRAMHAEMDRLSAGLEPGETILGKKKADPAFREHLRSITARIAKQEIQDDQEASPMAIRELGKILEIRKRQRDPARMREVIAGINSRLERALVAADQRKSEDFKALIAQLERGGYFESGDDLVERDKNDALLREAINDGLKRILADIEKKRVRAYDRALNELLEATDESIKE